MSGFGQVCPGDDGNFIKISGDNIIAVNGFEVEGKLKIDTLKIPYQSLGTMKITLPAGTIDHCINFYGLSDALTFLAVRVIYPPLKSEAESIEPNHWINYHFSSELGVHPLGQWMVQTGSSARTLENICFTNPQVFDVEIQILYATQTSTVINTSTSSVSSSFTVDNMEYEELQSHVVGTSLRIVPDYIDNPPGTAVAYISISNIVDFERTGRIVIINTSDFGRIYLDFASEDDAKQTHSALNWLMLDSLTRDLNGLTRDLTGPVITTTGNVTPSIIPSNPDQATLVLGGGISRNLVYNWCITSVIDNRDGTLIPDYDVDMVIEDSLNVVVIGNIVAADVYTLTFSFTDLAGNISTKEIELTVTP